MRQKFDLIVDGTFKAERAAYLREYTTFSGQAEFQDRLYTDNILSDAGVLDIGTPGTPDKVTASGEVYFGGRTEHDGDLYADANVYTAQQILAANGSLAAPAYAFAAGTNTGMFFDGSALIFGRGGASRIFIDTSLTSIVNSPLDATRIFNLSGALNLGASASTSHGLGSSDVLVGGQLEVNSTLWADSAVVHSENNAVWLGGDTGGDKSAIFPEQVRGQLSFLLGTDHGTHLVVGPSNAIANDFGHEAQPDPAVFVHSRTNPQTATNEWLGLSHNRASAQFSSGKGGLNLGAHGSASHDMLPSSGVYVGGNFEVDGTAFLDGNASVAGALIAAGNITTSGTMIAVAYSGPSGLVFIQQPLVFNSGVQSPVFNPNYVADQFLLGVNAEVGSQFILGPMAFYTSDFGHVPQTHPTFFIHSANNPVTNGNEWTGFYHDGSNARQEVGVGGIYLGAHGSPSWPVENSGVFISGSLEVNGNANLDGNVTVGSGVTTSHNNAAGGILTVDGNGPGGGIGSPGRNISIWSYSNSNTALGLMNDCTSGAGQSAGLVVLGGPPGTSSTRSVYTAGVNLSTNFGSAQWGILSGLSIPNMFGMNSGLYLRWTGQSSIAGSLYEINLAREDSNALKITTSAGGTTPWNFLGSLVASGVYATQNQPLKLGTNPTTTFTSHGLTASGVHVASELEVDGQSWFDKGLNVAGAVDPDTVLDDVVTLDNNGLVGGQRTTDTAPQGLLIRPQAAFGGGTQTAAPLVLVGGQDESKIDIDDWTQAVINDTVTITTVDSNRVVTATIFQVKAVAGPLQFIAEISNAQTAANLAACINVANIGVTATSSGAQVRLALRATTAKVNLAESRAAFTTVAIGTQGLVTFPIGTGDGYLAITNQTDGSAQPSSGYILGPRLGVNGSAALANVSGATPLVWALGGIHVTGSAGSISGGSWTPTAGITYANAGAGMLTTGTMTKGEYSLRTGWTAFSWTNAMVTALGAVTEGNVLVCTLPAKTLVKRAFMVVNTQAAGPTVLQASVGRTSTGWHDYVASGDMKVAANTVYGNTPEEVGSGLKGSAHTTALWDDLPNWTGTTAVNARFFSSGGNLDTVTGSTGTVYLQTELLP